jgi:hypothetical protein
MTFLKETVLNVLILNDEEDLKDVGFLIPLISNPTDKEVISPLKKQFKI